MQDLLSQFDCLDTELKSRLAALLPYLNDQQKVALVKKLTPLNEGMRKESRRMRDACKKSKEALEFLNTNIIPRLTKVEEGAGKAADIQSIETQLDEFLS